MLLILRWDFRRINSGVSEVIITTFTPSNAPAKLWDYFVCFGVTEKHLVVYGGEDSTSERVNSTVIVNIENFRKTGSTVGMAYEHLSVDWPSYVAFGSYAQSYKISENATLFLGGHYYSPSAVQYALSSSYAVMFDSITKRFWEVQNTWANTLYFYEFWAMQASLSDGKQLTVYES